MNKPLLSVTDLKVHYPVKIKTKGFFTEKKVVKAVDGISFDVKEGETLGIVGESGCGKSTTGKAIVRLNTPTEGKILYNGQDLFNLSNDKKMDICKEIQIVFQDPYSSLDPRFTIGQSIEEPLIVHKYGDKQQREKRVKELMASVGLRTEYYDRYPHEFSGGQRQRIGVARALALNPKLIVCDEPVSALDVSIQAQILNLMKSLQNDLGLTYVFISHDLSVVEHICDRIIVMYLGHIVESAPTQELFNNILHPYTKTLIEAIPVPDPEQENSRTILEGDVPSPIDPPKGCPFCTRCPKVMDKCKTDRPKTVEITKDHFVACHLHVK